MTMDLNQPLLDHCPFCDYALEGLPEKHVCPECGQPFDRRWVVFGGKSRWQTAKREWKILAGIVWGGMSLYVAHLLWSAPGPLGIFTWACFLLMIGFPILEMTRYPRRFVAVGPAGIALGNRRSSELRELEWSSVRSVDVDPWGRLRIYLKEKEITWSLGRGLDAEAHRCEEYVDKHFELPR